MLSARIKELRCAKGINQVQFAHDLNVTKQTISNWENDNIQPSINMLVKISKYFNVSTDYLLGLDNSYYIDADGLSRTQIAHIQALINDIRNK